MITVYIMSLKLKHIRVMKNNKNNHSFLKKKKIEDVTKELEEILKSHQGSYEKNIALFELVENIELEDIEAEENKRVNYLLRSRLFNELAKENYKEYQRA